MSEAGKVQEWKTINSKALRQNMLEEQQEGQRVQNKMYKKEIKR